MRVKRIVIQLEPESDSEKGHATELIYADSMWSANGPMFPRIGTALQQIYYLLIGKRL